MVSSSVIVVSCRSELSLGSSPPMPTRALPGCGDEPVALPPGPRDATARRVEDEAAAPGLVIGLRLPLRGEERFEVPVVVGEFTGVDVDLRRTEIGTGVEVPPLGDFDVIVGFTGAAREQERRGGQ